MVLLLLVGVRVALALFLGVLPPDVSCSFLACGLLAVVHTFRFFKGWPLQV